MVRLAAAVASGRHPYILAHEFFDALLIHAFEATPAGWRELLVSPSPPLSPKKPDFVLSCADAPTRHSLLLLELSPRYRALAATPGAVIEISPDALVLAEEIAHRIGMPHAGAALVVDYGPSTTVPANSLRGIRAHSRVSPLVNVGAISVSADVNFHALAKRVLAASPHVEVHGPVVQGPFLLTMGMCERLDQLTSTAATGSTVRAAEEAGLGSRRMRRWLKSGFQRLVDTEPGAMGAVYKVLHRARARWQEARRLWRRRLRIGLSIYYTSNYSYRPACVSQRRKRGSEGATKSSSLYSRPR